MKVVALFVAGSVEEAVDFANKHRLSDEFQQLIPAQRITPNAIDDGWHSPTIEMGHYVIVKVTAHRADVLERIK